MNHYYLTLAAQAAAQVDPHQTQPNPRVGCVVVKNGAVIATGTHQKYGEAHAEVNALNSIHHSPSTIHQSTIYITLEPCVHFSGKHTPACSDLITKLKPARVVVGALDPHFTGQGLAQLKAAGIEVELFETEHHQQLNPWFNVWHQQQRPFITLKVAQSLDGRITNGKKHLTNQASREQVHIMRAGHAAILTTTNTVLADDPQLNVRLGPHPHPLFRKEGEAPSNHSPFTIHHQPTSPDIIIMGQSGLPASLRLHQITGRRIHHLQSRDFNELISFCREQHYASIMTECGGIMNSALLKAGLVDQIELFTAPVYLGDEFTPSFTQSADLADFELIERHAWESDVQLSYQRR